MGMPSNFLEMIKMVWTSYFRKNWCVGYKLAM